MSDLELMPGSRDGLRMGMQVGRVSGFVMQAITRPVILLTRSLVRRDLGERYSSDTHFAVGLLLVAGATAAACFVDVNSFTTEVRFPGTHNDRATAAIVIGGLWLFGLVAARILHKGGLKARYSRSEIAPWHSYCSGVPRWERMPDRGWFLVMGLAGIGLIFLGLPLFGLLLLWSGYAAETEDRAAKARMWATVLDTLDAQIEARQLTETIREIKSPQEAEGLEAPLPAYVSPGFRRKLAETLENTRPTAKTPPADRSTPAGPPPAAGAVTPLGSVVEPKRGAGGDTFAGELSASDRPATPSVQTPNPET